MKNARNETFFLHCLTLERADPQVVPKCLYETRILGCVKFSVEIRHHLHYWGSPKSHIRRAFFHKSPKNELWSKTSLYLKWNKYYANAESVQTSLPYIPSVDTNSTTERIFMCFTKSSGIKMNCHTGRSKVLSHIHVYEQVRQNFQQWQPPTVT